ESAEEIKRLFIDGTEMVFITAGMGGGTGTGAAPVVAKLAKEAGMLTIGIVTVPFMFEGERKIIKALDGAQEMRAHVDALLVINNENLIELYSDYNFFNAFEKADDTLANAARSISDIISERCYINVDFQDVKTTLKDSGTAIISTAYGEGEHRISNAIHNALHSPLLKAHDINTSRRLLFKFTCSRESANALRAEEIAEITQFTSKLPSSIDVKWGIGDNPELGDKVKITVLASGFDITLREGGKEPDKPENGKGPIVFESEFKKEAEKQEKEQSTERIADFYGTDKVIKQRRTAARMKYAVLKPSQFDNHEVIALLESVPTFNRDPRFNDELMKLTEGSGLVARTTSGSKSTDTISFDGFMP
ncbi:MAG: cell division FtsZ family protein, partial [Muribaculaceae bacterium]|nr:cell division FtsZ family protein [Muribaculaceae bacterium]